MATKFKNINIAFPEDLLKEIDIESDDQVEKIIDEYREENK